MAGPGIEHWASFCGERASPRGVRDLIADPRWPDVMRAGLGAGLAHYDTCHLGAQMFSDAGMVFAGFAALMLDAREELTHSAFRAAASAGGLMSPGRASAMLARMRATGFVAPARTTPDGRVRRYTATDAMVQDFRLRAGMNLSALAVLDDRAEAILASLEERDALLEFCRCWGEVQAGPIVSAERIDTPFFQLIERHLAVTLVTALFISIDEGGEFPRPGLTPFSVLGLATRLRTSTMQTRRLLEGMAANGFVTLAERRIAVTPALVAEANAFFAIQVIGVAEMAARYLAARPLIGAAA